MTTPHRSPSVRALRGAAALVLGSGLAVAAASPASATPADDCTFIFDALVLTSVAGDPQLLPDYPCVPQYSAGTLELQLRSLGARCHRSRSRASAC